MGVKIFVTVHVMCRASGVNDINIFCGGTSLRAKREGVGRGVEPI